ncbi:MAG: hypothetical protein U9R60_01215, partial [Bacteroidota bacterium]|nr:hypothetical protein [Bacteroidota bacterium]
KIMVDAIEEGLAERKFDKEKSREEATAAMEVDVATKSETIEKFEEVENELAEKAPKDAAAKITRVKEDDKGPAPSTGKRPRRPITKPKR